MSYFVKSLNSKREKNFYSDFTLVVSPDMPLTTNIQELLGAAFKSEGFTPCENEEDSEETISKKHSCSIPQQKVQDFATSSSFDESKGFKNVAKARLGIDSDSFKLDSNASIAGTIICFDVVSKCI